MPKSVRRLPNAVVPFLLAAGAVYLAGSLLTAPLTSFAPNPATHRLSEPPMPAALASSPVPAGLDAATSVALATGKIGGQVVSSAGTPLADVPVEVRRATGDPYIWLPAGSTRSNSAGMYLVDGLPAGQYVVYFGGRPGLALPQYLGGAASLDGATTLALGVGEQVAAAGATLTALASISGRVTDAAGNPLAHVAVGGARLLPEGIGLWQPLEWLDVRTNAQGRYITPPLPPGAYRLHFADANGAFIPAYYGSHEDPAGAALALSGGEPLGNVDVSLTRRATLAGTVTAAAAEPATNLPAQGAPLAGILVEACRVDSAGGCLD
ncbi:MAG: hypothetical protein ACRC1H_20685, partial [Caldilineaceae bacterium]